MKGKSNYDPHDDKDRGVFQNKLDDRPEKLTDTRNGGPETKERSNDAQNDEGADE